MSNKSDASFVCPVCGRDKPVSSRISGQMVHGATAELIRRTRPEWSPAQPVCQDCLNHHRAEYMEEALLRDRGELSQLEREVVQSLRENELLSANTNLEIEERSTVGQRTADRIAAFGGSWTFIIIFLGTLGAWIVLNSVQLLRRPFDPFPFILLNLVLSCVAAIQAPVIMMSQNRQETRDRLRAEHDYQVNLKAELEIRHLHSKMDQLLLHQWERLLEIQRIQTEMLEELTERKGTGKGTGKGQRAGA